MRQQHALKIFCALVALASLNCGEVVETLKAPAEDAAAIVPCGNTSRNGRATYYTWADGSGNCSFPATPQDLNVAALNAIDYAGSGTCGSCITITGPKGRVTVRVVDQCPECPEGHVDLSPFAFAQIADLPLGLVPVKWHYVPCPVQGNIVFHFKPGSNQWWTAVQVRNHRNRVVKLEYLQSNGTYKTVRRLDYNYFVEPTGMGPGPYTFRVTDIHGNVLVSAGIPHIENGEAVGSGQFPTCTTSEE